MTVSEGLSQSAKDYIDTDDSASIPAFVDDYPVNIHDLINELIKDEKNKTEWDEISIGREETIEQILSTHFTKRRTAKLIQTAKSSGLEAAARKNYSHPFEELYLDGYMKGYIFGSIISYVQCILNHTD